jgi:prepilin-type N-terminal cleavage/methylation domain-containing protein
MIGLNNKKRKFSSGFTLIELLVAIVIFAITTGIVVLSQNKFDNGILLDNLAYDIAITIRQAQSFGINVKESGTSGIFSPYGVYFDLTTTGINKNFILFSDTIKSGGVLGTDSTFNGNTTCLSTDPECVQKYSIKRGSYIKSVCAGTSIANCLTTDQTTQLTVVFKRPNPDALIYNITDINRTRPLAYAKITVSSADGSATKNIVITSVGQIYVEK